MGEQNTQAIERVVFRLLRAFRISNDKEEHYPIINHSSSRFSCCPVRSSPLPPLLRRNSIPQHINFQTAPLHAWEKARSVEVLVLVLVVEIASLPFHRMGGC